MITYDFLQHYWFFLVSVLGGLLVFLLFVQGANAMMPLLNPSESEKQLILNSTGRKWELTFTTLVTFGGAFFASFPLFYSTSFGGAYWVWMLILLLFVLQAVAYEFQHRTASLRLRSFFRLMLPLNGFLAPFLIGAAVSTFFTGSAFTVNRGAMGTISPVISSWDSPWHGLEALGDFRNWLFGLMVMTLAMTLGLLYLMNNIRHETLVGKVRKRLAWVAPMFVVLFLATAACILLSDGFAVDEAGKVFMQPLKYLDNLMGMPWVLSALLLGVLLVLGGLSLALFHASKGRAGIWLAGPGTVLTVVSILLLAGFGGTAYYPSLTSLQSSLTIQNSCSSQMTLKVMAIVSLIIPFVLAYIWYCWRALDRDKLTSKELEATDDRY